MRRLARPNVISAGFPPRSTARARHWSKLSAIMAAAAFARKSICAFVLSIMLDRKNNANVAPSTSANTKIAAAKYAASFHAILLFILLTCPSYQTMGSLPPRPRARLRVSRARSPPAPPTFRLCPPNPQTYTPRPRWYAVPNRDAGTFRVWLAVASCASPPCDCRRRNPCPKCCPAGCPA